MKAGARAVLMIVLSLGAPLARADDDFRVKTGITETLGSQHYAGTSVFARFSKGDYGLKPAYSQYSDDFSSGTFRTLSLRGAYDSDRFGVGLRGGGSPQVNGYSNSFFGVDGRLSVLGDLEKPEQDAPGVEIGGGLTHTTHRDNIGVASRRLPSSVTLGQTDIDGWGSVELRDNLVTLDLTKSVYDRNVAALQTRASRVVVLAGLDATIQGFPNTAASLHYEYEGLPSFTPYASYTRTTFVAGTPHSHAAKIGGDFRFDRFEAGASYERYAQATFPDRSFVALNASLKF